MAVHKKKSPSIKPKVFDATLFLAQAGAGKKVIEYPQDSRIFGQGEPANTVFYIQQGQVKLTVLSRQGKEAVIGILVAGDFFGEGCMAGQATRMASATARCDCTVMRLEKDTILRILRTKPEFSELFRMHLLSRNIRVEEDLVDQLFNSSEKRLARALLLLANFGKPGEPQVIPRISQETLAEIVGTTRSRVSFFMNRFRKQGFINYNGTVEVNSSLLNVVSRD